MIGWSLGLVLENVGGDGRSTGRLPVACEIAVCTSVAAASMLLLRRELEREAGVPLSALGSHQLQPLICMNWRSSGVAMLLATVSGLAPG